MPPQWGRNVNQFPDEVVPRRPVARLLDQVFEVCVFWQELQQRALLVVIIFVNLSYRSVDVSGRVRAQDVSQPGRSRLSDGRD